MTVRRNQPARNPREGVLQNLKKERKKDRFWSDISDDFRLKNMFVISPHLLNQGLGGGGGGSNLSGFNHIFIWERLLF